MVDLVAQAHHERPNCPVSGMKAFLGIDRSRLLGTVLSLVTVLAMAGCSTAAESGSQGTPTRTEEEQEGRRIFAQYCASCHATKPEVVVVGPSLAGIADRAGGRVEGMTPAAYIERSIVAPDEYVVDGFQDLMPNSFTDTLTDRQRGALVAYLMTLK